MKTSSAKAKGRMLQNAVAAAICTRFSHLQYGIDVRGRTMGETGMDVLLSSPARMVFPFAVEARNQEKVNIWKAWEDAKRHASKDHLAPLAIVHKNRSDILVVLDLQTFLNLLSDKKEG